MDSLQEQVELKCVARVARRDVEVYNPPARHLELHALDPIVAVTQVLCNLGLRRQAVTVLWHTTIHRNLSVVERLSIRCLDMEDPTVDLVDVDWLQLGGPCATKQALFGCPCCRIVQIRRHCMHTDHHIGAVSQHCGNDQANKDEYRADIAIMKRC